MGVAIHRSLVRLHPAALADPGLQHPALEQELGEALGAEGLEVVEVEGLPRRCPATLPGSALVRNRRCGAGIRRLPVPSRPGAPERDEAGPGPAEGQARPGPLPRDRCMRAPCGRP